MIALIQLVSSANIVINQEKIADISKGILALIGIEKNDTEIEAKKIIERIYNYRIFQDEQGKTNLNLINIKGELLLVPQFTLVAETHRGTRPGFSRGMSPYKAELLFNHLVQYSMKHYPKTQSGKFGKYMQVRLCNEGPMTFILHS